MAIHIKGGYFAAIDSFSNKTVKR